LDDLFYSPLLSTNITIKICGTIFASVVLYGCELWVLAMGIEHRLEVEQMVPRWYRDGTEKESLTEEGQEEAS
jgi:hypothetical protein